MRPAILMITLALAAVGNAAGQSITAESDTVKQLAKRGFLGVEYDRIEDVTVIKGDEWGIGGSLSLSGPMLKLRLACAAPGQELRGSPMTCVAVFTATSGRGFDLGADARVTLLADDSLRVRLSREARSDVGWAGGLFSESYVFPLSPAELLELEGATEIVGRIGDRDFKLGSESRRTINGLASLVRLISGTSAGSGAIDD